MKAVLNKFMVCLPNHCVQIHLNWTQMVDCVAISPDDQTIASGGGAIGSTFSFDFAIKGTAEAWEKFWSDPPPPRHHDISALVREGKVRLEGNIDLLQANFLYLKLVLEQLRGRV